MTPTLTEQAIAFATEAEECSRREQERIHQEARKGRVQRLKNAMLALLGVPESSLWIDYPTNITHPTAIVDGLAFKSGPTGGGLDLIRACDNCGKPTRDWIANLTDLGFVLKRPYVSCRTTTCDLRLQANNRQQRERQQAAEEAWCNVA